MPYKKKYGKKPYKPRAKTPKRTYKPKSKYRAQIPRTIQSAAYKPKKVVVRHSYQNSFKIGHTDLWSTSQKNVHFTLTPNSASIFNNEPLNNADMEYANAVNTTYGTSGVTTFDHLYDYQKAYRTMQVLGARYTFNVRIIRNLDASDEAFEYPLKICVTKATTQTDPIILATYTAEQIENRPFTISRVMQQGPGVVSKGTNITINHTARTLNAIPKTSWIGHKDFSPDITDTKNIGTPTNDGQNGIANEGDYITFFVTSASQAAAVVTPEILVTMKASFIVRYSEPSFTTNTAYPIL